MTAASKRSYAFDIVGLTAMTLALTLAAIHGNADRLDCSILAFSAFCYVLSAVGRYRHA